MKIDFNTSLYEFMEEDKEIVIDGKPFTLRIASINALISETEETQKQAGEEKLKRYDLAFKIKRAKKPLSLLSEEVTLLKKKIGDIYGTLIYGQAYGIIEGILPPPPEENDDEVATPNPTPSPIQVTAPATIAEPITTPIQPEVIQAVNDTSTSEAQETPAESVPVTVVA